MESCSICPSAIGLFYLASYFPGSFILLQMRFSFLRLNNIPWYGYSTFFFTHSSVDGHTSWFADSHLLIVSYMVEKWRIRVFLSSYRDTAPINKRSTLMTKDPTSKYCLIRDEDSTFEFGCGTQIFSPWKYVIKKNLTTIFKYIFKLCESLVDIKQWKTQLLVETESVKTTGKLGFPHQRPKVTHASGNCCWKTNYSKI